MILFTLTRSSSLKRPSQISRVGMSHLKEADTLVSKLSKAGYQIEWDDNPNCILTRLNDEKGISYCCVGVDISGNIKNNLISKNITVCDNGSYSIIIIHEKTQKTALEKLYSVTGRIPVM